MSVRQVITMPQDQRILDNIEAGRSCPFCGSRNCEPTRQRAKNARRRAKHVRPPQWGCSRCGFVGIEPEFDDNFDSKEFGDGEIKDPLDGLRAALAERDGAKIAAWLRANISDDILRQVWPGPSRPYIEARNDKEANGRYEG